MSIPPPSAGKVLACLCVLGVASLCYLAGAAVMHFHLPSSDYLRNAFIGAQAWSQRGRPFGDNFVATAVDTRLTEDKPDRTSDGFTLYTTNSGTWAALLDMKGTVVHQWNMPFQQAWPHPTHGDPLPDNQYWFGFHLYPNGDLLAVYHSKSDTPYGYGLVKLDKGSKLLWRYSGNVHHEIDVGEDGAIYALTQNITSKAPTGMEFIPAPYISESLVILSPGGDVLNQLPILDALRDSKYVGTLELTARSQMMKLHVDQQNPKTRRPANETAHGDFTHPNSVKVLRKALAPQFPLFAAGQVLVSLRNMDALAVLDLQKRSVAWLTQGCWRRQHAADFLENGHLLLYDNLGAEAHTRVLEFDPISHAVPWSYSSEFLAEGLGKTQRLPNGNTLIVHPATGQIFEVTAAKKIVWQCFCRGQIVDRKNNIRLVPNITAAWRYPADQLTFLKGVARVRP